MNRQLRRLVASLFVSAASTAVCADQGPSPFPTSTGLYGAAVPAAPAANNWVSHGYAPAGAPVLRWPNHGYSSSYPTSGREAAVANFIGRGLRDAALRPVMILMAPVGMGVLAVKGIEYAARHGDAARPQE